MNCNYRVMVAVVDAIVAVAAAVAVNVSIAAFAVSVTDYLKTKLETQ